MMRIAIIGVGSIGGVLLGALSDTDAELVAVARGENSRTLSQGGLILHTPEGSIEAIPPERLSPWTAKPAHCPQSYGDLAMLHSSVARPTRPLYLRRLLKSYLVRTVSLPAYRTAWVTPKLLLTGWVGPELLAGRPLTEPGAVRLELTGSAEATSGWADSTTLFLKELQRC